MAEKEAEKKIRSRRRVGDRLYLGEENPREGDSRFPKASSSTVSSLYRPASWRIFVTNESMFARWCRHLKMREDVFTQQCVVSYFKSAPWWIITLAEGTWRPSRWPFLAMVDDGYFNFPRLWRFHRRHIGTSRASSSKSKLILFCVADSVHSCPSAAAVVRPKSKSSLSSSIVRPTSWWILEDARRRFHGGHISTMARKKKILSTDGHRRRRDV